MSIGVWFAYMERTRAIPLHELGHDIEADPDVAAAVLDGEELRIQVHDPLTGNDAEVGVHLDTGPHVAIEASELAELPPEPDPGVPPPDLSSLAAADARYQLTFELEKGDESSNVMLAIMDVLAARTGAIIFDATNDRFV